MGIMKIHACIAIKVEKIPVVSVGKAFRVSGVPIMPNFHNIMSKPNSTKDQFQVYQVSLKEFLCSLQVFIDERPCKYQTLNSVNLNIFYTEFGFDMILWKFGIIGHTTSLKKLFLC